MTDPLLYVRAIHFAATMLAAGVVFFAVFVAAPAWRGVASNGGVAVKVRAGLAVIAWIGLALAVISGAVWLVLTAAAMSDQPAVQVFGDGVLWTVLSQTTFGRDWLVRFVLACALAAILPALLSPRNHKTPWIEVAAAVLAATFAGALAWSGHAAGGLGGEAVIHPAADVLHLIAAAAWVGALLPLIVLFAAVGADDASLAIARTATTRFSILGIVSVGTLLVTGIVNTYLSRRQRARAASHRLRPAAPHQDCAVPGDGGDCRRQSLPVDAAASATEPASPQAATPCGNCAATPRSRLWPAPSSSRSSPRSAPCRRRSTPPISTRPMRPSPADAAFVHIHLVEGMADVTIRPGRTGRARATIRLWNEDFERAGRPASEFDADRPRGGRQPDAASCPARPRWRLASRWHRAFRAGQLDGHRRRRARPHKAPHAHRADCDRAWAGCWSMTFRNDK